MDKIDDVLNAKTNQNIRSQRDNWKICIFSHKHSKYLQSFLQKVFIQVHSFFDSRNLEFVKIFVQQDKTFL